MKLTLETNRLILRPYRIEDAEAMYHGWANDPDVAKYVTWNPHEKIETTRTLLRQWIREYEQPQTLRFAVTLKPENRLIGGIDVVRYLDNAGKTPVIGYALAKAYWNHGYMTEACQCLLDYLFSNGCAEVRIDAMPENTGSIRVIEKCGGIYIGTEQEYRTPKDDTVFVNCYVIKAE